MKYHARAHCISSNVQPFHSKKILICNIQEQHETTQSLYKTLFVKSAFRLDNIYKEHLHMINCMVMPFSKRWMAIDALLQTADGDDRCPSPNDLRDGRKCFICILNKTCQMFFFSIRSPNDLCDGHKCFICILNKMRQIVEKETKTTRFLNLSAFSQLKYTERIKQSLTYELQRIAFCCLYMYH